MGDRARDSGTHASASADTTQLLRAWRQGDKSALDRLIPVVYQDLRRVARRHLVSERPGHSLQATALVNEAYMRLIDYTQMEWQDRVHFLAVSAQLMRRILVDHARRHNQKRGGGARRISLDEAPELGSNRPKDVLALDDALNEFARIDARKARVVELRYFGGLSVEETAEALGVSEITIMRDWKSARAWLYRELTGSAPSGS